MSTFGEILRELRKKRRLSLRDLANRAGVDFTYLSKIETGTPGYSPSPWLICQLAQALDTSEDELLNLAGKIPPGLKKMMEDNPLLTELVRVLAEKQLPAEVYQQLLDMARSVR